MEICTWKLNTVLSYFFMCQLFVFYCSLFSSSCKNSGTSFLLTDGQKSNLISLRSKNNCITVLSYVKSSLYYDSESTRSTPTLLYCTVFNYFQSGPFDPTTKPCANQNKSFFLLLFLFICATEKSTPQNLNQSQHHNSEFQCNS